LLSVSVYSEKKPENTDDPSSTSLFNEPVPKRFHDSLLCLQQESGFYREGGFGFCLDVLCLNTITTKAKAISVSAVKN
jgi:hypothetical protein